MANTYFLHRIQKNNGELSKGVEIHTNMDDAIRSFWGRVKTGHNNPEYPNMTYVYCQISDDNGTVYPQYTEAWLKPGENAENLFFLHSIRRDGENVTKAIDSYADIDAAKVAYASQMEYGYHNPKFANVNFGL